MRGKNGRPVAKSNLPSKLCPACNRPFSWRKKWERDWDQVIWCSDRCRAEGRRAGGGTAPAPRDG